MCYVIRVAGKNSVRTALLMSCSLLLALGTLVEVKGKTIMHRIGVRLSKL